MKALFKSINLFLLGILIMPSFLLVFYNHQPTVKTGYYCDTSYFEEGSSTYQEVIVEYDTYTKTDLLLTRNVPEYSVSTQENNCAPKAAAIVLGYYDVYLTNLIPDYEPGYTYNNTYYYYGSSTQVVSAQEQLYTLMGTNTEAPGTSVNQFLNGFSAYVTQQGYGIQFTSCGALNLTTVQQYIQLQQPIVVFFNSYRYLAHGIQADTGTQLEFMERTSNSGHAVVCYGYREFTFTKDNTTWTEKYLWVSFGNGTSGLMDINNLSRVDASYAVNIYEN